MEKTITLGAPIALPYITVAGEPVEYIERTDDAFKQHVCAVLVHTTNETVVCIPAIGKWFMLYVSMQGLLPGMDARPRILCVHPWEMMDEWSPMVERMCSETFSVGC